MSYKFIPIYEKTFVLPQDIKDCIVLLMNFVYEKKLSD